MTEMQKAETWSPCYLFWDLLLEWSVSNIWGKSDTRHRDSQKPKALANAFHLSLSARVCGNLEPVLRLKQDSKGHWYLELATLRSGCIMPLACSPPYWPNPQDCHWIALVQFCFKRFKPISLIPWLGWTDVIAVTSHSIPWILRPWVLIHKISSNSLDLIKLLAPPWEQSVRVRALEPEFLSWILDLPLINRMGLGMKSKLSVSTSLPVKWG